MLLILSVLLSSCSEIEDNEEDIILQTENKSVITIGIDSIDTFNPILSKSTSLREAMNLIYEPLFSFDEQSNPISVLAENCIASDNGYTYTVKIKENILWHDGKKLTSNDVLHSANLIRYSDTVYTDTFSAISSIYTKDLKTVVFKLKRPVPNFVAVLSFPVVPNHLAGVSAKEYIPIGTGPFKYDKKINSDIIRLVGNKKWTGETPAISQINLNILKSPEDALDAFNAGAVDVISTKTVNMDNNVIRGEVTSYEYVSDKVTFIGFNTTSSLFNSPNVRNAISHLINREEIVENCLFSRAKASIIPINPSSWYYPKLPQLNSDAQYVKDLLVLDGWEFDGEKYIRTLNQDDSEITKELIVNILVNDNNEVRLKVCDEISKKLSAFGIKCNIEKTSFDEYVNRVSQKDYDIFIGEVELPKNMDLYSLLAAEDNYFGYKNTAMNTHIKNLGTDSNNSSVLYNEFANYFIEQMPFITLYFKKEYVYFNKNILGQTSPNKFNIYKNPQNWYVGIVKNNDLK